MKLPEEKVEQLNAPLPNWAITPHPTKRNMSVIHPMAVVDRLNDVFGVCGWDLKVEKLNSYEWFQKTKSRDGVEKERKVYTSTAKVTMIIKEYDIHKEQFGGSTNDDEGDALKGAVTDGLTKISSYLGIGASIYKGEGNIKNSKTRNSVSGAVSLKKDFLPDEDPF